MLQVKHLTMTHTKDLKTLIHDLNFTLNTGDKMAIIGNEGNGKSTLLKWIMADDKIEDYIQVEGELVNQFSHVEYLPQFLPDKDSRMSLEDYFFGADAVETLDYAELYNIASQLAFDPDRLTSTQILANLSGGERIKVQLIKILAKHPDLLLLDEPSNDLDLDAIYWLEHFIRSSSLTILFISHDEALLKQTASRILHIELLRHKTIPLTTVANLDYTTYVQLRNEQIVTQTQIANKQREEHDKKMEKYRRIESSVHDAQNKISRQNPAAARLLKKKMHAVKSMEKRFEKEKDNFEDIPIQEDPILIKFSGTEPLANGKTILTLDNYTVSIDDILLAQSINLLMRGPQKIGIVGKNGVGKSTFLKQLWNSLKNRTDINVGYMPQNYQSQFELASSPIDFLSTTGDAEETTQIMTYLGSMRFTADEMKHPINELSGGQQAKLFLLKMDLNGDNVLLLDEPTRNFSPLSQPELRKSFATFKGAIITISHDRQFLKEVCDKVLELTPNGLIETIIN